VTDSGTNLKRVYDFLLARNSNLGPILHRFGDITGFFALPSDRTHIPPQFWGVPVAPDGMAHVGVSPGAEAYAIRP